MLRSLLILALVASSASAFQVVSSSGRTAPPTRVPATSSSVEEQHCTRRDILQKTTTLGFLATILSTTPANADVIRSPGKCANGEGEGCDSLSENNELIRSLQKKSSDNREANEREYKRMVKKLDGSFALYSPEDVKKLSQEGKIKIEYPMSKGGRIVDLTQKPVLVLNE